MKISNVLPCQIECQSDGSFIFSKRSIAPATLQNNNLVFCGYCFAPFPSVMLFLLLFLCCFSATLANEVPYRAVRITATAIAVPRPVLHLQWNADSTSHHYEVSRKTPDATGWGVIATGLSDTVYADTTIEIGKEYEYQVIKFGERDGRGYSTAGYCSAGAEIPFADKRGTVAVVVDSMAFVALPEETSTLEQDLEGDGWHVRRVLVGRAATFDGKRVRAVKREIQRIYDSDKQLQAVLLIGKIPVPYSGRFAPDDHDDHLGAWPADCYYGDVSPAPLDERWSDLFVLQTTAFRVENQNRRVDGKFDQSELPSNIELAVGRIDFSDLPVFAKSEMELLRDYLHRNHEYRHGKIPVRNAACFRDNFGLAGGEMFSQSAWSNATSFFGNAGVLEENWVGNMSDSAFQFGSAGGAGSYTSADNVGASSSFVNGSNAVFGALMGSYFGDWDNQNNFMRSALVGSATLATWWSGRPKWHLHRCASGQPLGTAEILSINNDGTLYEDGRYTRGTHIALLGDPTLRFFPVPPPENLVATATTDSIILRWNAPAGAIAGYAIYRNDGNGFVRLNPLLSEAVTYAEPKPAGYSPDTRYMVRAVRLQTNASCSFYSPSQGIMTKPKPQSAEQTTLTIPTLIIEPMPMESTCEMRVTGAEGEYSAEIMDIFGRMIAVLPPVRFNCWHWDSSDTAAGVYTVRLISKTNEISRLIIKR